MIPTPHGQQVNRDTHANTALLSRAFLLTTRDQLFSFHEKVFRYSKGYHSLEVFHNKNANVIGKIYGLNADDVFQLAGERERGLIIPG